ncbi:MAG: cation:proton antiporter [Flavobacteriales bacterium]|nr:cation:proton antiporter [Flavobacteriales bacterium]
MPLLDEIAAHPFHEFAIILLLAALLGGLGQLLRQPLIVMFIALGILVGPSMLDVVKSKENIELLAEIGIAVLLFIVGLKLDLRLIKSTGKIALLTGLGQVLFTAGIGYLIGLALGFSQLHSFYIAVALTFSSTIIIVKLLTDKKEIDALHGQIAIGFLIVQDIVVILVMIVLSALARDGGGDVWGDIAATLGASAMLVAATFVFMRFVIPRVSFFLARSQELLALFAVAWAVGLASLSQLIGFSGEVGAFLAGVSLASSPFRDAIGGRLISLRDFLLLFFFVNLGVQLDLNVIGAMVPQALVFSLFVLIGNPIIVLLIMGAMGYRKRTGFLAGLTVAQISEFSLIFAGLGLQVGHLDEETVGLITLVGLITIGLSTYMILYSAKLYEWLAPMLGVFERKDPYREKKEQLAEQQRYDLIIFGMGRFGGTIAQCLHAYPDITWMGIDFDPQVVRRWQEEGRTIMYGDIEDPDLLDHVPWANAGAIVSTIPVVEHSLRLLTDLERHGYKGEVFVAQMNERDAPFLEAFDSAHILRPHAMAAESFHATLVETLKRDRS